MRDDGPGRRVANVTALQQLGWLPGGVNGPHGNYVKQGGFTMSH